LVAHEYFGGLNVLIQHMLGLSRKVNVLSGRNTTQLLRHRLIVRGKKDGKVEEPKAKTEHLTLQQPVTCTQEVCGLTL